LLRNCNKQCSAFFSRQVAKQLLAQPLLSYNRKSEARHSWKKAKLSYQSSAKLSLLLRSERALARSDVAAQRKSFALSVAVALRKLRTFVCRRETRCAPSVQETSFHCFATFGTFVKDLADVAKVYLWQTKQSLEKSSAFLRRKLRFLTRESEAKRSCKA
jgi:hypothetical protein